MPAKVNLQLSVGPKESDGYHEVVTVFQAISLFDNLKISRSNKFEIDLKGDYVNGVPTDQSNLVYKAVQLMSEKFNTDPSLEIEINKSIPVAGGMAGGSADAAAVLLGLNHLTGNPLSEKVLISLGKWSALNLQQCGLGKKG